jgi:hypothetical protein
MTLLAGPLGAELAPDVPPHVEPPTVRELDEATESGWSFPGPRGLTKSEATDLDSFRRETAQQAPDDRLDDAAAAYNTAWTLHANHERAVRHVRWLRSETELLLAWNASTVRRVARALLQHNTLSGADVRTLVTEDRSVATSR